MSSLKTLEDAKVLLYLANKSKNYDDIVRQAVASLGDWQQAGDVLSKEILLTLVSNSEDASVQILSILETQLLNGTFVLNNLEFLSCYASLQSTSESLIICLFNLIGFTEKEQVADLASQAIHIHLSKMSKCNPKEIPFTVWWPKITRCLDTTRKLKISAGLRVWFSCLATPLHSEVYEVIKNDGNLYFKLLQREVANASKYALQSLLKTLENANEPINNDSITFDPFNPESISVWARFASLIDILGIDSSLHQMTDSLADLVKLMLPDSLLPPSWCIILINVGMRMSNTKGIRVLTTETVLCLHEHQMKPLVLNPLYVAEVLYPRFLQTPSFVVVNNQCLHADHLESFTRNYLNALVKHSIVNLREFVYRLGCYFVENSHAFEVPRVLIANVMRELLPPNCLTKREADPLLAASRASVLTYNSKAMADLYAEFMAEVVQKTSVEHAHVDDEQLDDDINEQIEMEVKDCGFIHKQTFNRVRNNTNGGGFDKLTFTSLPPLDALMDSTLLIQQCVYNNTQYVATSTIKTMLENEIKTPRLGTKHLNAYTVELALDYIDSTSFEVCDLVFQKFSTMETRLAALRCFRRSNPQILPLPLEQVDILWSHLKETTLRILDRELHHEFIDFITTPGVCNDSMQTICLELIELCLHRKNLLYPLAKGLMRFSDLKLSWVDKVMVEIFTFIPASEYALQMEELLALRFNVYQKNWGRPESHARALAAYYILEHTADTKELFYYVTDRADLLTQVTGSLNNFLGNKRVLYFQILIMIERHLPKCEADQLLGLVQKNIQIEANPPVRVHAEWLIALLIFHHSERDDFYVGKCINGLGIKDGTPPRLIGSYIRIGLLLFFAEHATNDVDKSSSSGGSDSGNNTLVGNSIGEALIECIIPMATSNRAVVRHRSVSAIYIINESQIAPPKFKELIAQIAGLNAEGVIGSSYQNDSFLWSLLDLKLGSICGGVVSTVYKTTMPQTLLKTDFCDIPLSIVGNCWNGQTTDAELPFGISNREKVISEAVDQNDSGFSTHVQTKSASFDIEDRTNRTELIVVATLCDKPVNQGAISRLSDALGVKKLVLRDLNVLQDQNFKSTALTSEKWLPLEEQSEANIVEYLKTLKSMGYVLVGIEQTDTSKKLTSNLAFPEKCVLIMGHEREGIPAEILALLNACIEIEQRGYVRSMNIQTATAIMVHAYNQQHSKDVQSVEYV